MKSSLSIWRYVVSVKFMVKILSIFVAFLGNMNFMKKTYSFDFMAFFESFTIETLSLESSSTLGLKPHTLQKKKKHVKFKAQKLNFEQFLKKQKQIFRCTCISFRLSVAETPSRVNFWHISSASRMRLARSMYLAHLQLMYL